MYHLVYLITNLKNDRIYVGKHSTYNLEDGYLGSSEILAIAIQKYGKENFKKTILFYCLTEKDAFEIESAIVDETFVNKPQTYNIKVGGLGRGIQSYEELYGYERALQLKAQVSQRFKGNTYNTGRVYTEIEKLKQSASHKGENNFFYGKKHTPEEKAKMRSNNPKVLNYKFISPDGEIYLFPNEGLRTICQKLNLSYPTIREQVNRGKINLSIHQLKFKKEPILNCWNWTIETY